MFYRLKCHQQRHTLRHGDDFWESWCHDHRIRGQIRQIDTCSRELHHYCMPGGTFRSHVHLSSSPSCDDVKCSSHFLLSEVYSLYTRLSWRSRSRLCEIVTASLTDSWLRIIRWTPKKSELSSLWLVEVRNADGSDVKSYSDLQSSMRVTVCKETQSINRSWINLFFTIEWISETTVDFDLWNSYGKVDKWRVWWQWNSGLLSWPKRSDVMNVEQRSSTRTSFFSESQSSLIRICPHTGGRKRDSEWEEVGIIARGERKRKRGGMNGEKRMGVDRLWADAGFRLTCERKEKKERLPCTSSLLPFRQCLWITFLTDRENVVRSRCWAWELWVQWVSDCGKRREGEEDA